MFFQKYRRNIWQKLLNQNLFNIKIFYGKNPLNGIDSQRKDTIHNNQENLIYFKKLFNHWNNILAI